MAEIEIIYREGYCEYMSGNYCAQCHTQVAGDHGCPMFNEGEHEKKCFSFRRLYSCNVQI